MRYVTKPFTLLLSLPCLTMLYVYTSSENMMSNSSLTHKVKQSLKCVSGPHFLPSSNIMYNLE